MSGLFIFIFSSGFSQNQSCPANINFSTGSLTHWFAYTGNNKDGNGPTAIMQTYDSTLTAPTGTIGAQTIQEYQLPSVPGISVKTTGGTDTYGGFSKIPTINGYQYNYSILLGSTSISHSSANGTAGGYIRGISYQISVPAGPPTEPYTMTYAYAMVLENGSHNSDQQPLFRASLMTSDSVITCASPEYYLPTDNNAVNNGGATLDSAGAIKEGFSPSRLPSPNPNPNGNGPDAAHLYDVWTKGWTEVTFDLSPYRGQDVTLTFEADNCVPGGHFAYAYVALRNTCGGLIISGDSTVCNNSKLTYSVPALGGSTTYQWMVPSSWTIVSGGSTNIITVSASTQGGVITAEEKNSCADLEATIPVTTSAPPVGGNVTGNATVCAGDNSNTLVLNGKSGNVIEWVSSQDGISWSDITDQTTSYTAQNLTATTEYEAVVQSSTACPNDSSSSATITVDQKSVGGTLNPAYKSFCIGQNHDNTLTLTGETGQVVNWQSSQDNINWANFNPANRDSTYNVLNLTTSTLYRTIVKNGVCAADTSAIATIKLFNVPYPQADIDPADTSICYGQSAELNALITVGTNYSWVNYGSLNVQNQGNGAINSTPSLISADATPSATTNYIFEVENAGCPDTLTDTFRVNIVPKFTVSAGNDTAIVINQPLQLQATSTDITSDTYTWSPGNNLDNPDIASPVAIFGAADSSATYTVKGIDSSGCFATGTINIEIYNLPPNLYVPTAFTPNGDGLNDIFKPILIGMKSLTIFRVYNRWGQLVFSTSNIGVGWDGTYNGSPQNSGNYVWIADGVDYEGRIIQQKGNVILIR